MAATVDEHRRVVGDVCPGWRVPAHISADLTADHVVPITAGGLGGDLVVLCQSCNSRKRNYLGSLDG